ncbi:or S-antigen, C-terminal domain-domain-containing protein [Protomyces lactucae-debilis]|uniref:Or S-antigen, C-terminal domain-domain-containing protein n=1 Tax=Protomyces lactucae-debilis TaxID=2754530 RepID=A0A1Y2EUD4_PROLT|nr:or S-antigen, C-terminal domain-containing protein [Protomyces lactucae-debilis]ORY75127.1 or S-antigen, C-terminal domain-domain-containing protein [Protomyces lactucae-debilis]
MSPPSLRSGRGLALDTHQEASILPPFTTKKAIASTGGGTTNISIALAEPVLFLTGGFDSHERHHERPTMLRGTLMVQFAKPTKIKAISLQFSGKGRTDWPEGIPPKKQEFFEEKQLMHHVWTFFNAQYPIHEHSHGADRFVSADASVPSTTGNGALMTPALSSQPTQDSTHTTSSPTRSGSISGMLPLGNAKSFSKHDAATTQLKGSRVFAAGEYYYDFELPIPSFLPETINCEMGKVCYELSATVERAGAFKSNLAGKMPIQLIRTPGEANMESSEPIAISRNWEDQLHYDIVISGKSFPLGQKIPIAFKLTPLAKVRVHRIKVFVTETVEYWCKNKKVHRLEPTRKILLKEKNAGLAGGANESLLGNIDGASNAGATEFDIEVPLPTCQAIGKDRIHFDTTFANIKVHHWIKVVLRLSKADPQPNDPAKRRHFEISIDSPIHLLSCRCVHANTQLPTYSDNMNAVQMRLPCPCEIRAGSGEASPVPVLLHHSSSASSNGYQDGDTAARPMHFLRQPSTLPPPFSADSAPPPLMTPPPNYDFTPGHQQRAIDYFTTLSIDGADDPHRDRASDDSEVGTRTPGLHPAMRSDASPVSPTHSQQPNHPSPIRRRPPQGSLTSAGFGQAGAVQGLGLMVPADAAASTRQRRGSAIELRGHYGVPQAQAAQPGSTQWAGSGRDFYATGQS